MTPTDQIKHELEALLVDGVGLSAEYKAAYETAMQRGEWSAAMVAIGEVAAIEARMIFVRQVLGLAPAGTVN